MYVQTIFGAGTDTSSVVLEYAMVRLMQHPHAMNKLQAEVRGAAMPKQGGKDQMITEDELSNLAYLKAVIKETLRLHMPAPLFVPHLSMADCDVEGYTIPAGTRTIVNGWALARDPNYWESAEEFMPERFMEGGSAATMDYKGVGDDFLFLPFGSGRRMCPGMNFAMSTVEVMLANLVYHFNWELPLELQEKGIDMTESFGVVVHRSKELLLVPVVPPQE
jgi:cytochrome P450